MAALTLVAGALVAGVTAAPSGWIDNDNEHAPATAYKLLEDGQVSSDRPI